MSLVNGTISFSADSMAVITFSSVKVSWEMPSKHFFKWGCTRNGSLVSERISNNSSLDRKKNLDKNIVENWHLEFVHTFFIWLTFGWLLCWLYVALASIQSPLICQSAASNKNLATFKYDVTLGKTDVSFLNNHSVLSEYHPAFPINDNTTTL